MDMKQYNENTALWYLGQHKDADTTDDLGEARTLYKKRIKDLEIYVDELERTIVAMCKYRDYTFTYDSNYFYGVRDI